MLPVPTSRTRSLFDFTSTASLKPSPGVSIVPLSFETKRILSLSSSRFARLTALWKLPLPWALVFLTTIRSAAA